MAQPTTGRRSNLATSVLNVTPFSTLTLTFRFLLATCRVLKGGATDPVQAKEKAVSGGGGLQFDFDISTYPVLAGPRQRNQVGASFITS